MRSVLPTEREKRLPPKRVSLTPDIFSIVKAIGKDIIPRCQIIPDMGLKGRRSWRIHHFNPAREDGFVEMTKPDHPNSPSQMYRLTEKGLRLLAALNRIGGQY